MDKVIALDIGGVCLELRYDLALEYFGCRQWTDIPPEAMGVIDRYERGSVTERQWLDGLRRLFGKDFTDNNISYGWNLIIGGEFAGMGDMIREYTRAGFRFVFFSDTSPLHMMEAYRKLSFAHLVSGAVLSYEVGAKKPEKAMFQAFERKYGKPWLYIDDREDNIRGGFAAGWDCCLFSGVNELRRTISAKVGVFSR